MKRRSFLQSLAAAPAACLALPRLAEAALPKTKITRVRIYKPSNLNPLFNQSNMLVTVETEAGITGIGEGGAKDTLEQCAGSLIGKDPFKIEAIWQEEYMAWFYPPAARSRMPWAPWTWRFGTSKARPSAFPSTRSWAGPCATIARPTTPAMFACRQPRAARNPP